MQILLSFAPFIVFALLTRIAPIDLSLWAASAVSAALIVRQRLAGSKSIKLLEAGTLILFVVLAIYTRVTQTSWSVPAVRTVVDGGLLVIMLASMAIRQPFTLQYAREQAPLDVQSMAGFIRANYIITLAWVLAFAVVVAADVAMDHMPAVPLWVDSAVLIAALAGAVWFTRSYSEQRRRAAR
jgi:hypothetical protein